MSKEELINKLKNETKNINFSIDYENDDSIIINYYQKNFSIYGSVDFDKDTLESSYADKYIKMVARDIVRVLGKKVFLGDKE